MRLTLRTLLAYLDDTLPPSEIKEISQKVAESDTAQELIARIKQVTRRRRLTTPPTTGPGGFEPNTIAEYLDNTLPTDQVAEVEKVCLESDVHLAEIAACHQILTLVLGEPALVPPTAKQRMYGLVRGRESNRRRRAPAAVAAANEAVALEDGAEGDEVLMGLPYSRRSNAWLRWLLPVIAGCLLLALGLVIGQALAPRTTPTTAVAVNDTKREETPPTTKRDEPPTTKRDEPPTTKRDEPPPPPPPPIKSSNVRGQVQLLKGFSNLLLQHQPDRDVWQQLNPNTSVVAPGDTLVALPGYRSEIKFDSGVGLLLWGNLPELLDIPLLESGVILRKPSSDCDLELTLDRGRIVLTNQKTNGPVKVRVLFNEAKPKPAEIWEVTLLDQGTEVAFDLFGRYPQDVGFQKAGGLGPKAEVFMVVLHGQVNAKIDENTYSLHEGGSSLISWDNFGSGLHGPDRVTPTMLSFWTKSLPETEKASSAKLALTELIRRPFDKPIELILEESLHSDRLHSRVLAIFSLAALDVLPKVLDALADEDERRSDVREASVLALRHWIGRQRDHDLKLYQILVDVKRYTPNQAETIMQLLHNFPAEQLAQPQTWEALIGYVKHDKSAIRTLSYWHLYRLVPEGRTRLYNPAGDTKQREVAYEAWKKLIPDGKLPQAPKK